MKVFISWSGERSRRAADSLRKYLPFMLPGLQPFMSQHDLTSGARWSEQLAKELDASSFGLLCLTPENLKSEWLLFEAGALTKHVEGHACCLLFARLAPADVTGPLAQFQNRIFSREGLQKVVFDINDLLEKPLDRGSLQMIFDKWWSDLDGEVTVAMSESNAINSPVPKKRDVTDLLEELLLRVRNLERVVDKGRPESSARSFSDFRPQSPLWLTRLGNTPLGRATLSLLRRFVTAEGTRRSVKRSELDAEEAALLHDLQNSGLVEAAGDDEFSLKNDQMARFIANAIGM